MATPITKAKIEAQSSVKLRCIPKYNHLNLEKNMKNLGPLFRLKSTPEFKSRKFHYRALPTQALVIAR